LAPSWDEKAALNGRLFHIWRSEKQVEQKQNTARRTSVYVDGYNLYYGRLRGTTFKWLDLVAFFDALLKRRDQNEVLTRVNIYTAWAFARFSTHGDASVQAQSAYHRALQHRHGERVSITYGSHSMDDSGTLLPTFVAGQAYDRNQRSRVWKIEEKKTDVNLALGMYRDAVKGLADRVILVSNDSDTEPVLEALRQDFPHIMIGVVMPRRPVLTAGLPQRRRSGSLAAQADWTIDSILDEHLQGALLPDLVPTNKKPIRKPSHW
jgi:uncharacterized LabA/DUF88 family protein